MKGGKQPLAVSFVLVSPVQAVMFSGTWTAVKGSFDWAT